MCPPAAVGPALPASPFPLIGSPSFVPPSFLCLCVPCYLSPRHFEPSFELVFLGLSLPRAHRVASITIAVGCARLSRAHGSCMQSVRKMILAFTGAPVAARQSARLGPPPPFLQGTPPSCQVLARHGVLHYGSITLVSPAVLAPAVLTPGAGPTVSTLAMLAGPPHSS